MWGGGGALLFDWLVVCCCFFFFQKPGAGWGEGRGMGVALQLVFQVWIAFMLTVNCAKVLNNDSITQYYLP